MEYLRAILAPINVRALGLSILFAALCGLSSSALLMVIYGAIARQGPRLKEYFAAFVALSILKLGSGILATTTINRLAQDTIFNLRTTLCRRILNASLDDMERIGRSKFILSFTEDINTLAGTLAGLPTLFVNVGLWLGLMVFLSYLSVALFLSALGITVLGLIVYVLLAKWGSALLARIRDEQDTLHSHFVSIVDGLKEFKLRGEWAQDFLRSCVEPSGRAICAGAKKSVLHFALATTQGEALHVALLGFTVFFLKETALAPKIVSIYCIFFMLGPLQTVVAYLPSLNRVWVMLQKLERLGLSLKPEDIEPRRVTAPLPRTSSVTLKDVEYRYSPLDTNGGFTLGPISMTLCAGKVSFLIGSNGSGKTTLAKILTGLYSPLNGEIYAGTSRIHNGNVQAYRQCFSAVFADHYLLQMLPGSSPEMEKNTLELLQRFQLASVVSVKDGRYSSIALSHGQRRRLAIVNAILEDRPFYVFDEWSSDQDSAFQDFLYLKILPELRQRGKAILVISHEEDYYSCADQIFKLHCGKLDAPGQTQELPCVSTL